MSENPYSAPDEPVRAELVRRQSPPLGYMLIATAMLAGILQACVSLPWLIVNEQWSPAGWLAVAMLVSFSIFALAMRPVWRWYVTGKYH